MRCALHLGGWVVLAVALAACGGSDSPAPTRGTVAEVGRADPVRVEVADTPAERERGLMGRTSVPPGTGMVFRYSSPSTGRYWMRDVPVPLTAVFARDGVVVGVVDMPPCPATTADCPTYGPDSPFDTVLETAPETLRGLVAQGERLVVRP